MSIWRQALRRDRLSRFVDVARREGLPRALGKARAHVRLIRSGQGAGSVPYLAATVGGRFARTALWADLARGEAFHAGAAPAVLSRRRSVALIGDLNLPQCRKYRVEQMVEIWSQLGVGYRYAHVEDVPRCLDILQDASHVVLYRLQASDFLHMYLYEARRLRLPMVYDIDDPIFSASALAGYSNIQALGPDALAHAVGQAPLYLSALSMADAVSVATPQLAEHLAGFTARPIWLRRNFLDAPAQALGRQAREARGGGAGERFTAVLASGSRGRRGDLEALQDVLSEFLARDPARRLLCLGDLEPGLIRAGPGQIMYRAFTRYGAYLHALAEADVVLVPLSGDRFNACKSAVRVLDAGAVGRAAIVPDIGDLPVVLRDGQTGIVARRPQDWADALERLASAPGLGAAMGEAAFDTVRAHWSARNILAGAAQDLTDWVTA